MNETIECSHCGIEMRDELQCREDMVVHEEECNWPDDPHKRFEVGDRIKYSDFGRQRLDRDQRKGEIVGFSEQEHCVRVQWDELKTPNLYAHQFIKND